MSFYRSLITDCLTDCIFSVNLSLGHRKLLVINQSSVFFCHNSIIVDFSSANAHSGDRPRRVHIITQIFVSVLVITCLLDPVNLVCSI